MNGEDRHVAGLRTPSRRVAPRLVGDLLATALCYADAIASLVGLESRVWSQIDTDIARRAT